MDTTTPLDQVTDAADKARAARTTYRATMAELRQAITAADRADATSRNQIAAAAAPGMSRDLVYKTLGAADLESDVRRALAGADALVHHRGGRVEVELGDDALDAHEVTRLNWAAGISNALRGAGLILTADFEDLARVGASIQVVRRSQ